MPGFTSNQVFMSVGLSYQLLEDIGVGAPFILLEIMEDSILVLEQFLVLIYRFQNPLGFFSSK